jgi:tartrate-resistant acid phosphatase type 5
MKKIIIILLLLVTQISISQTKFAVIGDYGTIDQNQANVANLVKSWRPNYIITTGDNLHVNRRTFEEAVGWYYGDYKTNDTMTNRFFAVYGNHDDIDYYGGKSFITVNNAFKPFINYFQGQPNPKRYWSKTFSLGESGNTILINGVNSDYGGYWDPCPNLNKVWEPDGIDSNSIQGRYFRDKTKNSNAKYKTFFMHMPFAFSYPYDTATGPCGKFLVDTIFQRLAWPYAEWGGNAVFAGHTHLFEIIIKNKIPLIIQSLGNYNQGTWDTTGNLAKGNIAFKRNTLGASQFFESGDSLRVLTINTNNDTLHKYAIYPQKSLRIQVWPEGMIGNKSDTIKAYLRLEQYPHGILDSCIRKTNSKGEAIFWFPKGTVNSNYHIQVKHRNSISKKTTETIKLWYNVSDLNLGTLYSGDVNQDGIIDALDASQIDNDALNFKTGYLNTDINNDYIIDSNDLQIIDENLKNTITE